MIIRLLELDDLKPVNKKDKHLAAKTNNETQSLTVLVRNK